MIELNFFSCLGNMALVKVLSFVAIFAVFYQETEGCLSNNDCPGSLLCCNYRVCLPSCVNQSCILNSNCGGSSYCCNSICRLSCVDHYCDFDMDCGAPNEYCCYNTCEKGTCSLAGWAIALIVIGACTALVIFGIALCLFARRRRPAMIVTAPAVVPASNVNYGAVYPQPHIPAPPYAYYNQQPTQQQK